MTSATATHASTTRPEVRLRAREEKRLLLGHPWAYGNELQIDNHVRAIPAGSLVRLRAADGRPIGTATFNLHSLIAARVLDRDPDAAIDDAWFRARLARAAALRARLFPQPFYRLIHSEADGLPGFIVDRFGDVFALQANTAGAEALTPMLVSALATEFGARAVVARNESAVRKLEGLALETKTLSGQAPEFVAVPEGGCTFPVDVVGGQKTGWYFDLRPARQHMADLARGAGSVLDLYCHTGAFAVQMAAAGTGAVLGIDGSAPALDVARRAAELNGVAPRCQFERHDALEILERFGAEGRRFDVLVADPPSFVKSRKELASGARGYRKLARLASACVAPGGIMFIASCSHHMAADLFFSEVAAGLAAAGRTGRVITTGGAGPDHPLHPQLPESAYIKYLILQID